MCVNHNTTTYPNSSTNEHTHSNAPPPTAKPIRQRNQTLFGVSKRTASNDHGELTAHGLLAVEGAGRTTKYRLPDPDA